MNGKNISVVHSLKTDHQIRILLIINYMILLAHIANFVQNN